MFNDWKVDAKATYLWRSGWLSAPMDPNIVNPAYGVLNMDGGCHLAQRQVPDRHLRPQRARHLLPRRTPVQQRRLDQRAEPRSGAHRGGEFHRPLLITFSRVPPAYGARSGLPVAGVSPFGVGAQNSGIPQVFAKVFGEAGQARSRTRCIIIPHKPAAALAAADMSGEPWRSTSYPSPSRAPKPRPRRGAAVTTRSTRSCRRRGSSPWGCSTCWCFMPARWRCP